MNMGKSNIDKQKYVYRIENRKEATKVRIGNADLIILKVYKERYNISMTAVLHEMIGTAAKCWEEKHDEKLKELEELRERVTKAEFIMALYFNKYGPLRVKRNVRDSIIKPEKESLDKPD